MAKMEPVPRLGLDTVYVPESPEQLQPGEQQFSDKQEVKAFRVGRLQSLMDSENYLYYCILQTGDVCTVKLIWNAEAGYFENYGFVGFTTEAVREKILEHYNGLLMPSTECPAFKLNWSSHGTGKSPWLNLDQEHSRFGGALAPNVTCSKAREMLSTQYPSIMQVWVTGRITPASTTKSAVDQTEKGILGPFALPVSTIKSTVQKEAKLDPFVLPMSTTTKSTKEHTMEERFSLFALFDHFRLPASTTTESSCDQMKEETFRLSALPKSTMEQTEEDIFSPFDLPDMCSQWRNYDIFRIRDKGFE